MPYPEPESPRHYETELRRSEARARRAAREAERSRSALQALLDSTVEGIYGVDTSGKVTFINPAGAALFGYQPDEMLGQHAHALVHGHRPDGAPYPVEECPLYRSFHGGYAVRGDEMMWHRDGSPVYVTYSSAPIRVGGRVTGSVITLSDASERRRVEAERERDRHALEAANQQLREALANLERAQQRVVDQERLRALGQMAAGVAHDLNNTLAPVAGFSELLLAIPSNREDPEKLRQYLELIHTGARDAAEVVRRMREFYRRRDEEETYGAVDVPALVEHVVALTRPRWKDEAEAVGRTIHVLTDVRDAPPARGREAELREALTNLVLNAVDAMPGGGTITLRAYRRRTDVVVEVADTGTGMPEEVRRRCLEPFFTTKGTQGTGLGLAIVHGMVRRHGGHVEVDSVVGQGTTVRLRLPAASGDAEEMDDAPARQPALRALVVDDDAAVRAVTEAYLAIDGHQVETATDGSSALERLRRQRYDVLITDRAMPGGMAGDQLAAEAKRLHPALPVILLTGVGDVLDTQGRPWGVDLVLSKPTTRALLRDALTRVVTAVPISRG